MVISWFGSPSKPWSGYVQTVFGNGHFVVWFTVQTVIGLCPDRFLHTRPISFLQTARDQMENLLPGDLRTLAEIFLPKFLRPDVHHGRLERFQVLWTESGDGEMAPAEGHQVGHDDDVEHVKIVDGHFDRLHEPRGVTSEQPVTQQLFLGQLPELESVLGRGSEFEYPKKDLHSDSG